jgi:hypothetical protein
MRQMLYNANAGQAIVSLNTSNSNPTASALALPHQYLSGNSWTTFNTESYVTLAGGSTTTYYVWVTYGMTPNNAQIANESYSNRVYSDLFAAQM